MLHVSRTARALFLVLPLLSGCARSQPVSESSAANQHPQNPKIQTAAAFVFGSARVEMAPATPEQIKLHWRTDRHACVVLTNGDVGCREGDDPKLYALPELRGATEFAIDSLVTCGLWTSGEVRCFARTKPWSAGVLRDVLELRQAEGLSCARTRAETVACWGASETAQSMAYPTLTDGKPPVEVGTGYQMLIAGSTFLCGLSAGRVLCWGVVSEKRAGERCRWLGRDTACARKPFIMHNEPKLVRISGAGARFCGFAADGQVLCRSILHDKPDLTATIPEVVQIAGLDDFACARTASGRVYCIGKGYRGNGQRPPPEDAPASEVQGIDDAQSVEVRAESACVMRRSGERWCWGVSGYDGCVPIEELAPKRR